MKKSSPLHNPAKLRCEAKMRLRHDDPEKPPPADAVRMLEELQVYQHELEMQKEELTANVEELEHSKARLEQLNVRYASLFDFAPNGYLTIDVNGRMTEANVTFAAMVGIPRGELIGRRITDLIHRDDQDVFYLHRKTLGDLQPGGSCDLRLKKNDGTHVNARFHSRLFDPDAIRIAVSDISDRIWFQKKRDLIQHCLEIANHSSGLSDLLEHTVLEIKQFLDCSAVGIRLLDEDGGIPYQAYDGFSRSFYEIESPLSIHTDQCMCTFVIRGETPADKPFYTAGGSFYINGTTRFLRTVPEEEKGATRNVCHQYGYESVALVPIAVGGERMGLIHAADHREERFPLKTVETLEELAGHLSIIINRVILAEQLASSLHDLGRVSSLLLQAQEDERKRIAAELHDQTGQDLNYLKLTLWNLVERLPPDQEELKADFGKALEFTDRIIGNVRNLLHGLTPSTLKDLGIVPALEGLIDDFSEVTGIKVACDVSALAAPKFSFDAQISIYRIIQELLTNISKHVKASAVKISTRRGKNHVEIRIEDDGKGFSGLKKKLALNRRKRMGLSSMALRCRLIGASLTFEGREGEGTCAVLRCPVKGGSDNHE